MPNKSKNQKQQKQQKTEQRKRALSSETSDTSDDLELILDAVVGALSNEDTLNRFVSALLEVQQIRDKLLAHLLPSLQNQISDILKPLQNSNNDLNKNIMEANLRTDDLEQYTRRHSLRITGIPEFDGENTDILICEFLHKEMQIEINVGDIDRSHRLGKKQTGVKRPIAVRFINYRLKEYIYANKKHLKGGYYINESLSKGRSNLFYKARKLKKEKLITDTWTRDGNVFIKTLENTVKMCTREYHLPVSFAQPSRNETKSKDTPNNSTTPTRPGSYAAALKTNENREVNRKDPTVNPTIEVDVHKPPPSQLESNNSANTLNDDIELLSTEELDCK